MYYGTEVAMTRLYVGCYVKLCHNIYIKSQQ